MPANPYGITEESAKRCIDAAEYLFGAVDWSITEEGHDYWAMIYMALYRLGNMTPEHPVRISFSRRRGNKVFVVRDVDGQKYIRDALIVLVGMDWERTPEGDDFWAVVYDALGALIT